MEQIKCTNCGAENSTRANYCCDCGHVLPNYQTPVVIEMPVALPRKKQSVAQWIGLVI
ncbi:MAG: hypothetical protein ACK5JD_05065 [Mangrovibacterium sp.]